MRAGASAQLVCVVSIIKLTVSVSVFVFASLERERILCCKKWTRKREAKKLSELKAKKWMHLTKFALFLSCVLFVPPFLRSHTQTQIHTTRCLLAAKQEIEREKDDGDEEVAAADDADHSSNVTI